MNSVLEQGYCQEILAKLATRLDGMSYDELKDYIRGRQGSRRHFEATFIKSLLDVLIHTPFDFRTIGGVNRIVRSESAPLASTAEPARPRVELVNADAAVADDATVLQAAMLAELPPGGSKRKTRWQDDTRHRPEVVAMGLDETDFDLSFEDLLSSLMFQHEVRVDPAKPHGPDPWLERSGGRPGGPRTDQHVSTTPSTRGVPSSSPATPDDP